MAELNSGTSEPQVSIIIPVYNDTAGVLRLLSSCEYLTYPRELLEIIIVDDGSKEPVEKILSQVTFDLPLKTLRQEPNRGRAAACNRGAEQAKGDVLLFIDSDMEVSPDLVLNHLAGYEYRGCVATRGEYYSAPFVKKNRWFKYLDNPDRGPRKWARQAEPGAALPFQFILTGNFSIKREVFEKLDGFDENITAYGGEDTEFAYRLSRSGLGKVVYCPEAVTYHHHHGFKETLKLLYAYGRYSIPYLIERHPELAGYLPIKILGYLGGDSTSWSPLYDLFLNPVVLFLARAGRLVFPEPVAFQLIRYILGYAALSGYRDALKERSRARSRG